MSAKVALISAFIALQVADVLTTQHVLAFGGFEANPLGAWAMDHCGAWWPLAKLAPMALVAVVMTRWPPRYIVPAVALMAAVVASNPAGEQFGPCEADPVLARRLMRLLGGLQGRRLSRSA
jgi:Domain of unknown function (DUF5658)